MFTPRSLKASERIGQLHGELISEINVAREFVLSYRQSKDDSKLPLSDDWNYYPDPSTGRYRCVFENEHIVVIESDTLNLKMISHFHKDKFFEVAIVVHGSVLYAVNDTVIKIGPGQANHVDATADHTFESSGLAYLIFNKIPEKNA